MLKIVSAIASAILLFAPSFSFAQTENAQVTGSVAYRERIALPSDAVIDVQLIDTSVTDIAAQTVAEVLINAEGRQVPVPFTLTYDPAKVGPGDRYSVRATIRSGDGMLMFSTTQAYPVLTHGAPSKVNLLLHTVGHAAHSKAAAKMKEAASSPAETAPAPAAETTSSTKITEMTSEKEPTASATATTQPAAQPPVKQEAEAAAPPIAPGESAATPPAPNAAPSETPSSAAGSVNQAPAPETAPSTPPAAEQSTPPVASPAVTGTPATATAEGESSSRESKSIDSRAATEPSASAPEDKPSEPTASAPASEAKAVPPEALPEAPSASSKPAQAEAPLPEAPSATKHAELAATAPDTAEPEAEATSRPARPAPPKAATPLADTQWKLIQLGGQDVVFAPMQKPVTLAFSPEGRRIAGSAGCNSYLGTFTDDHGHLELHPGNMTMMLCGDPAGSREKKFVAMLRSADGYKINGDFLILTSNGKTVAKFKNNPPL